MNPLVSVVIPVHNGEYFLRRTLASALGQTYTAIEVVVVDDGSTDESWNIVTEAAVQDDRIRVLRGAGKGPGAARNLGISQARGALIAPMDHDDLWHPEKIARQVKRMQSSSAKVGLVYCWSIHIDENDYILPGSNVAEAQGHVTAALARGNFIHTTSSTLIKRYCIDAVSGFDAALHPQGAEDWKLYLALSEICDFAVLPEYLVGYRQWGGNMSRNIEGMARSTEHVAQWMHQKWPDISEEIRLQRLYDSNNYFAGMALETNRLFAAMRYRMAAYRIQPGALFSSQSLIFGARILARMIGVKRGALKRLRRVPQTQVLFPEFGLHGDGMARLTPRGR
jgi:glycosyltransferase involved in cell wall biosynthesis